MIRHNDILQNLDIRFKLCKLAHRHLYSISDIRTFYIGTARISPFDCAITGQRTERRDPRTLHKSYQINAPGFIIMPFRPIVMSQNFLLPCPLAETQSCFLSPGFFRSDSFAEAQSLNKTFIFSLFFPFFLFPFSPSLSPSSLSPSSLLSSSFFAAFLSIIFVGALSFSEETRAEAKRPELKFKRLCHRKRGRGSDSRWLRLYDGKRHARSRRDRLSCALRAGFGRRRAQTCSDGSFAL